MAYKKSDKKILVLSPNYYPMQDGLGHYTKCFVDELKRNLDVGVISSKEASGDEVVHTFEQWNFTFMMECYRFIKNKAPDRILIQYLPFLYRKRSGIDFNIVILVMLVRLFTTTKIDVMFHELSYPLEKNYKALLMWCCHHLMFFIIGHFSHHCLFSTTYYRKYFLKYIPSKRNDSFWLSVGSNTERVPTTEAERAEIKRSLTELPPNHYILLGYGGLHPDKHLKDIPKVLAKNLKSIYLHLGVTTEELRAHINPPEKVKNRIFGSGFLSDRDVSRYMQIGDAFVSLYSDGITSRRGSILAALQNGIPVFTTFDREKSDQIFINHDFIVPVDHYYVEDLIKNEFRFFKESDVIETFFQTQFSWNLIVDRYLTTMQG